MQPPIVIGATGGSGTRVVARIVRLAGCFLGTHLNASDDALEFVGFYDSWINRFVSRTRAPLSDADNARMARDFDDSLARHRREIPHQHAVWGWKGPRSI